METTPESNLSARIRVMFDSVFLLHYSFVSILATCRRDLSKAIVKQKTFKLYF